MRGRQQPSRIGDSHGASVQPQRRAGGLTPGGRGKQHRKNARNQRPARILRETLKGRVHRQYLMTTGLGAIAESEVKAVLCIDEPQALCGEAMTKADFQLDGPLSARRIVVAMSGGVDSSVVAALAAASGAETIGVTLQLYDHGEAVGRAGSCCAGRDIRDARAVCDRLGIAHYVFDHESAFREQVIDDFANEYMAGRTPIPCVKCNMGPKFTDLFRMARDLGADCLATGHYVRRVMGAPSPTGKGRPELHRAIDPARDQSYFLFATTADQLNFLRFPLGGMEKAEVRALAAELGLAVAAKPDSQDICFVPDGDYAGLVRKLRPEAAADGEIVSVSGDVLGRHRGLVHYTVGQRRGLEIGGLSEPLYVVRLEPETRRLIVGPKAALAVRAARLSGINWLGDDQAGPMTAKVRSLAKPVPARREGDRLVFETPEYGVAPGQAAVFYAGDRVLGGGWIEETEAAVLSEAA
jgi:tRNA-specific 2-thiouridylase